MALVLHLFRAPYKRLPMEELEYVPVVANAGFERCAHARRGGKRQVLLVDRETLEAMNLRPGIIRENITTDGLNVNSLQIGQQLGIGEARLEVSAVCHPAIRWRPSGPDFAKSCGGGAACCAVFWWPE